MGYKSYSEYSSSEVDWLGDLPEHWKVSRLKWSVRGCINGVWGDEPNGLDDVVCIRVADFNRDNFTVSSDVLTLRSVDKSQLVARSLQKGDLLIEKSGGGEKQLVGCVVYFDHDFDAVSSNFVARMPVEEAQNPRFWCYQHASLYAAKVNFLAIKQTTGIQNLDSSYYLSLLAAYPPPSEQKHIADFLDWKTGQIDALIAKKRQLIEKLQEQRIAVITRAVTKGLNPDVPVKDSGIPWLGQVPEHWEVMKLRFMFKFGRGLGITKASLIGTGIPCINYGEVHSKYGFEVVPEVHDLKCVSEDYLETNIDSLLSYGDFVFADTSEDIEGSGNFSYLNSCMSTFAGYHTVTAKLSEESNPRYLAYLFDSQVFRFQIRRSVSGIKVFSVTQGILKNCYAWLPPNEEQGKVVEFLDQQCYRIDSVEQSCHSAIEKLTEYRTALITAATTGKIDVRNVTVPTSSTEQLSLAFAEDEEHRA